MRLLLELWVVALELLRSPRLSRGWHLNHAVLRGSTTRTTSSGSWHSPLLLFGDFTSLHSTLLMNGGAG
jgi:hypothetical protein